MLLDRRGFLKTGLALAALGGARSVAQESPREKTLGTVLTVAGPVRAADLGVALPHEHVLVDFIGADQVGPDRYDRDEVVEVVLPHLKRLRDAGCGTLFECTPAWLGRDGALLKRLSNDSGLRLVTNTGYYGAREGKFLPKHAFDESADQIAARWLTEWRSGIDESEVRPGFIKIGVDAGPLSEVNRKLVRAAARTHLRSGLTIAAHTGDGAAALEQLALLREEGASPQAWIWVHAQNENDAALHRQAAEQGAWVEFDGIGPDSIARHVELLQEMKKHNLLGRVLISHDAGWYSVGEPRGGDFRPYDALFTRFLPELRREGFGDEEIQRLTVTNPAEAFTIRVRER